MVNSEGAAGPRAGAPSVPAGAMCISAHGVLVVGQNLSRAHLGAFKRCLDEVLAAPDKQMVLDFSGCLYVSSLLIGQLVDGIMRARERGKTVRVLASPEVGRFFRTAQLDQLFAYAVEEKKALPVPSPATTLAK